MVCSLCVVAPMVPWRPGGLSLSRVTCGVRSVVAATGSCVEFLFFFHFILFNFVAGFHAVGLQGTPSWRLVGCCHSRLLVGSAAFLVNRGFLWSFPDLVGGLCCCALMLHHALICVFISGFRWLLPPSRAGMQIRGSLSLVCKAAAAFFLTPDEVLKFAFVLPRVANDCFGTVRMCVAGGGDANVYTMLLRGWHRPERCQSPAVLQRRMH